MGHTVTYQEDNLEDGVTRAHVARYLLARGFIEPGDRVLDAACGCGQGAEILSRVAGQVYALDFLRENCDHGMQDHNRENITWFHGDLDQAPLPECEAIVSIETIEHVADPEKVVAKMQDAANRVIIASVPIGKTTDTDPTHKSDFMTENDFKNLFKDPNWMEYHSFNQGNHLLVIYRRKAQVETEDSQQNPRW